MASDMEKTVKSWIKEARKHGFSDERIRREMLGKGYSSSMVEKILESPNIDFKKYGLISLGIITVIGLIVLGVIYIPSLIPQKCITDQCFISAANQCKSVEMDKNLGGSVYSLSERNCIFTKTVKTVNETETPEITALLKDASMTCSYDRNGFNDNLVTTLSLGIDNCSGDLKDALEQLLLAA